MSLVDHARHELALIGEDQDTADGIVKVIQAFADCDHAGYSAPMAIDYLDRLLRQQPLSPLTSDASEWVDRTDVSGYPLWQSTRDPRAFSEDGGKTWDLVDEHPREADVEDLDGLTRAELAELGGAPPVVASVLDDWLARVHGILSGSHNAGLFLDLLAARGYQVTPIDPGPPLDELLPPPQD